jgi:hypothetical protein
MKDFEMAENVVKQSVMQIKPFRLTPVILATREAEIRRITV